MPPRKNTPLCAIRIGYQTLIMPAADGMKVVALLANAMDCDEHYGSNRDYEYEVGDPVQVTYKSVRPGQIVHPIPSQPLRLEHRGD